MRKLQIVPKSEKETLKTYLNNYLIELSQFDPTIKFDKFGLPVYKWFDCYWEDKTRYPIYLIVEGKVAGFALIRELNDKQFEIAEFFVTPSFRENGNALWFASSVTDLFGGQFEFSTRVENLRAIKFWDKFTKKQNNAFSEVKKNYKSWVIKF